VPEGVEKFDSKEHVEWFEMHSKQSKNPLVYMLNVKVYDVGGSLLSSEEIKLSRSYESLTSKAGKNNLQITIHPNYTIDYAINKG
jgi:hypothetical protein